jgi:hypothetical protein
MAGFLSGYRSQFEGIVDAIRMDIQLVYHVLIRKNPQPATASPAWHMVIRLR